MEIHIMQMGQMDQVLELGPLLLCICLKINDSICASNF